MKAITFKGLMMRMAFAFVAVTVILYIKPTHAATMNPAERITRVMAFTLHQTAPQYVDFDHTSWDGKSLAKRYADQADQLAKINRGLIPVQSNSSGLAHQVSLQCDTAAQLAEENLKLYQQGLDQMQVNQIRYDAIKKNGADDSYIVLSEVTNAVVSFKYKKRVAPEKIVEQVRNQCLKSPMDYGVVFK